IITSQLYQKKVSKRHKRLDSEAHRIETPLLIGIEKERNYQDNTLLQLCWDVDLVETDLEEDLGTQVQSITKVTGKVYSHQKTERNIVRIHRGYKKQR